MSSNAEGYENFVDFVDVVGSEEKDADSNDNVNLIPDECFTTDSNTDDSTKYICKQCNKPFKSKHGVKQHVGAMHKSKKRAAGKTENFSRKYQKKAYLEEDLDQDEVPSQAEPMNSTSVFLDEFLDGDYGQNTLSLDLSIENLVKNKIALHSTAISDEDDDESYHKPDQDHDTIIQEENDVLMMKAKLISLEMELVKKDTLLNEQANELKMVKNDLEEVNEKLHVSEKEKESKDEALDIATGKINSLEDDKLNLQKKMKKYSLALHKFRTQSEEGASKDKNDEGNDKSDKEKEVKAC